MDTQRIDFEQALGRLEEIVKLLECSSLPLDDAIKLYEEGVSLVRAASVRLNEAKQRISIVDESKDE